VELVEIFNTPILKKHEEKLVVIYLGAINRPANGILANWRNEVRNTMEFPSCHESNQMPSIHILALHGGESPEGGMKEPGCIGRLQIGHRRRCAVEASSVGGLSP
jgi:hypothetical protein